MIEHIKKILKKSANALAVLWLMSGGASISYGALSETAYDFSFKTLKGQPFPLSQFKGSVILVVNTASNCGLTPQYADLEKLYEAYKPQGFIVIAVPSNDFGGQEPGSNEEIGQFCALNYGVTFPITSKEKIRGAQAHPFYLWAKKVLGFGTAPKWNFHKYLINRQGHLVDYFEATTSPTSDSLRKAVENALSDQNKPA